MSTLDATACAALLEPLTAISAAAAQAILAVRGKGGVRVKADGSPVTPADEAAEATIREGLIRHWPTLPVVSEEAERDRPMVDRGSYFLVDPLDGTRDFVAGRDEYTVNIALVTDGTPILGVIAAPALGLIWRGIVGHGAERIGFAGEAKTSERAAIRTRPRPRDGLTVMVSRSHLEARTQAYVDGLPGAKLVACGSSVKFCRLAEGAADLYPRLAPTRDWDVAAGHAILSAAGGSVTTPDGSPLAYGTTDLRIPAFVASGDPMAKIMVKLMD
jgi:3'(2'), 5'-bisphosphate nucleotidase